MRKYIITEQERNEVMTVLLEMQAKFSFNVLQIMGTLPEISQESEKIEENKNQE